MEETTASACIENTTVFGNFMGQLKRKPKETSKLCILQTPSFTGLFGSIQTPLKNIVVYHPCKVTMKPRYGRLQKQNNQVGISPVALNFHCMVWRCLLAAKAEKVPLKMWCKAGGDCMKLKVDNMLISYHHAIGKKTAAEPLDNEYAARYTVEVALVRKKTKSLAKVHRKAGVANHGFHLKVEDAFATFRGKMGEISLPVSKRLEGEGPSAGGRYSLEALVQFLKHVNVNSTVGFSFEPNGTAVFYEWRFMLVVSKLTLLPIETGRSSTTSL
jgi:hypothetical protein